MGLARDYLKERLAITLTDVTQDALPRSNGAARRQRTDAPCRHLLLLRLRRRDDTERDLPRKETTDLDDQPGRGVRVFCKSSAWKLEGFGRFGWPPRML